MNKLSGDFPAQPPVNVKGLEDIALWAHWLFRNDIRAISSRVFFIKFGVG
jgi:hypothetical protein